MIWYRVTHWSKDIEKLNVKKELDDSLFVSERDPLMGRTLMREVPKQSLYTACFRTKKEAAQWLVTYLTAKEEDYLKKYTECDDAIQKIKRNYKV